MDCHSDNKNVVALQQTTSFIKQGTGPGQGLQQVTIGTLPDDVLLVIFVSFQAIIDKKKRFSWDWMKLAHVCQRWRYIIFESPIRLNLQIICTVRSPVRKSLDVWPPFPLTVLFGSWDTDRKGNTVAALEQHHRVHQIHMDILDDLWKRIVTVMQKPFPELRSLAFQSLPNNPLHLSDTFLNGSAPSLQVLVLQDISFPSLPRLLSSTGDLTSLHLRNIPDSGYIPPEEMATSLSALPKLKSLIFDFKPSLQLHLKEMGQVQLSPPATRFVLPTLTQLEFEGVSEYLETLAARIDAPLLDDFQITFFHQAILGFDDFLSHIPQTIRFFGLLDSFRSSSLTLKFHYSNTSISFPSNTMCHSETLPSWYTSIDCKRLDWQVISVARICSQMPFCSHVKSLNIRHSWHPMIQKDVPEIDSMLWSQLFHTFSSVQCLEIPAMLESSIAPALQGLMGESAAEVLPSLQNLSIVGNETAAREGIARVLGEQPTSSRFFISRSP